MTAAVPDITPELALRATLHRLRTEAEAAGAGDVARALDALDDRVRSRRLLVAVVGEHNRGKSTLVNSLIGEPWLPMGQAAPALPPVYVFGGAREHVELVYADGNAVECTQAELLSLSPDDAASVSYARVAIPSADIHGLMLVDTPGLNDPDTARLAQTVYGLMPQSDLALLVLDSAQAFGASEYELLEKRIATAGLHRLVVVLNRDDALEDEAQRVEVRRRVERLLKSILGTEPEVLPYAARAALRARERNDARLLARSGYPELRAVLASSAEARAKILLNAVAKKASTLAVTLRSELAAPSESVTPTQAGDSSLVLQADAACRELQAIQEDYKLQLQAFTLTLRDRLPDEAAEASTADIRRLLPFYIQEQFGGFVLEHEGPVRDRIQLALRDSGVAEWPVERLAGIVPAPGLHPYVEPDFLEDSLLLTTFMTLIGLTMKPIVAGAMMSLGPIFRMLTRNMYDKDTKSALLMAAMAATTDAGLALERAVDQSFSNVLSGIRASVSLEHSTPVPQVVDDSAREAARERVSALIDTLTNQAPTKSTMQT